MPALSPVSPFRCTLIVPQIRPVVNAFFKKRGSASLHFLFIHPRDETDIIGGPLIAFGFFCRVVDAPQMRLVRFSVAIPNQINLHDFRLLSCSFWNYNNYSTGANLCQHFLSVKQIFF